MKQQIESLTKWETKLLIISQQLIERIGLNFQRSIISNVSWDNSLIGIKGARGVGKTTMLLQQLKKSVLNHNQKVYVSLDELYFTEHTMLDFGRQFYQQGGRLLVLDEVHKYKEWSREIKNLHDRYTDLQIYFTGSSILDITKQEGDLSRRALFYDLQGLSFREYLALKHGIDIPAIQLEDLLQSPQEIIMGFDQSFLPYQYFSDYLKFGYYPFEKVTDLDFHLQLRQLTRAVIEQDMAEIKGYDVRQAKKLLQLIPIKLQIAAYKWNKCPDNFASKPRHSSAMPTFIDSFSKHLSSISNAAFRNLNGMIYIIAQQKPFKPNISKLSQKTNIHRNSLPNYLYFLEKAKLISLLQHKSFSVSALQKSEKIFLENTNLIYALSEQPPNKGTIREVFVYNQLSQAHLVNQSPKADFLVDQKYTFEVGGFNKNAKQIADISEAYIIKDNLELPVKNSLPIWMLGFLY